jgi:hypothetical protein
MPEVSVCIVNWRTRDHLDRCLASLAPWRKRAGLEVLVADNASGDGSVELVREKHDWARLFAFEENLGHSEGNNRLIEASSGEFVLLLNPDILVPEGAIPTLVAFMRARDTCGAVAPRLDSPDGTLQHTCRTFPTPDVVIYEALGLSRLLPHHPRFGKYRMTWWDYGDARQVDQPMASALLLRRAALDQVGLFDPQFPIYFGDVDLCLRLKQAGWEVWLTPDARMTHFGGASTRQVRREMVVESHASFERFYEKHYRGRVKPVAFHLALGLLRLGRAGRLLAMDVRAWLGRAQGIGHRA